MKTLLNERYQRIESDSIGEKPVLADAFYGIQTLRALENFHITGMSVHPEMIHSIALIKKAAAITNMQTKNIKEDVAHAIIEACDAIIEGKLHDQFITDPIQGGAGTSFNMNANEVIANYAITLLGGKKGDYTLVNPNDDVNCSQSTNDVFPTSGKMTMIRLIDAMKQELERLCDALASKAIEFDHVIKMGRTQLQDAVPIRLGQEFRAYYCVVSRDLKRLERAREEMLTVNMGGTAIGTGINASPEYIHHIVENLATVSELPLQQAKNLIDATQNLDGFLYVSSVLKTCAVNLSKIANDLRLMSSGPKTGLGEVLLPKKQNGSSIMPGKINPVIPEVINQVAFQVIGNDITVTMAVEGGQLELNAFEPVIFHNVFQSIEILTRGIKTFVDNCILGIQANETRCRELVESSAGLVTVLCPYIGYGKATEIAKEVLDNKEPLLTIIKKKHYMHEDKLKELFNAYSMTEQR
ncbi:aspartate ammonia-lyase [Vallitaleaceae bacterium 9-2]